MKRILITCPYAFTFRNLVQSGLASKLSKKYKVFVAIPDEIEVPDEFMSVENLSFINFKRPRRSGFLNLLFVITSFRSLFIQSSNSFLEKLRSEKFGSYRFKSRCAYPFPRSVIIYETLKKMLKILGQLDAEAKRVISLVEPELFIASLSQRVNEAGFLAVAKSKGICTVAIVNSWDVITTKGSFVIECDEYWVWNKFNKLQIEGLFKKLRGPDAPGVRVVGAPHFDFYHNQRQLFRDSETILYSTSPLRIFPGEKRLLLHLADLFNKRAFGCKKLLIRVHPQAVTEFEDLKTVESPCVKVYFPSIEQGRTEDRAIFSDNFFSILHEQIKGSLKTINVASTMSLDSLACRVPVGIIAFDDYEKLACKDYYSSVKRYLNREHYRDLVDAGGVEVLNSFEELVQFINNPKAIDPSLQKEVVRQFLPFFGGSQVRVVECVDSILKPS